MAVHNVDQPPGYGEQIRVVRWVLTTADHTGDWIQVPWHRDYSVHAIATAAGGATASIEGSNEIADAPTSAVILADTRGGANPLSFTASGLLQGLQAPLKMRARLTAVGAGASWTVIVKFARD